MILGTNITHKVQPLTLTLFANGRIDLDMEQVKELVICHVAKQQVTISDVARLLNLDRRTVTKYLRKDTAARVTTR